MSIDPVIAAIFSRFFPGTPRSSRIILTGRDEADFRVTALVTTAEGPRYVLKLADNDFTFPDRIRMWQRTVEEYRDLGYYCPRIFADRNGDFPTVEYAGRPCAAYGEEFSRYRSLEDRTAEGQGEGPQDRAYFEDLWRMTARVAAKKLDYAGYPSAYCLFDTFCPSDAQDEVLENALEWKRCAEALPEAFAPQVRRIWTRWRENRAALEPRYATLPTSVFQADLNPTNLLVDEEGRFMGVCDFNLSGRDVFLNYLMREVRDEMAAEIEAIRRALTSAARYYAFSDEEKAAALPLYRCLKPLWYTRVEELKAAGTDEARIQRELDQTERYLTEEVDFVSCMGGSPPPTKA